MGLSDIVKKARQPVTIHLHGTTLQFCELGIEEDEAARKLGAERALAMDPKASEKTQAEFGGLYIYFQMMKKAGETVMPDEFFSLPRTYHEDLVTAINVTLKEKVHTEIQAFMAKARELQKASVGL